MVSNLPLSRYRKYEEDFSGYGTCSEASNHGARSLAPGEYPNLQLALTSHYLEPN
jgi:hypothetical protein